ncbi:MAG: peptidase [Candidatus Omnitrophica bacterium CG08_land_8_20_14_0_20_41_16]|uniref:Peptidase n=1 Tax=Candidatus Sherwoodlollariibacterium unditelluris TaxID=1974757 RepID=A0A2G9YKE4_9BACT|nr:MAG: peptidase [Candidatus Omnitrophica bacterium CG23_combo_of_CG06-09_8_20_14_all_41_10]PIS34285.1 MAG: peptidase [Candidatus Omnitrophica bacterium CG08_land_8_20_14_0_20_41_16]
MQDKAKRHSNIKYSISIVGTVYTLILLFLFLRLGFSNSLSLWLINHISGFLVLPAYLISVSLGYYLLDFPLNFYQSYTLEHKFSLSTQSLKDWLNDQFKAGAISYIIGLILISIFYLALHNFPNRWWLVISAFWIFFSIILAKIMPVVIIPLFFKYKKLSDNLLRERIMRLAERMKINLMDCFEIDFSKKTLKANAAFVGMGKTRRVLLADTLRDKYSHDEIEVILAHEFAHYQLKHLLKLIVINSFTTFIIFYAVFKTNAYALRLFNISSLSDIASLPLVLIYFMVFGIIIQPLEAFISRSFERSADSKAIEVTGLKDSFISTMNKFAQQNLADRNPHPIIKFFFFDHPPIDERIKMAKLF